MAERPSTGTDAVDVFERDGLDVQHALAHAVYLIVLHDNDGIGALEHRQSRKECRHLQTW